MLRKGIGKAKKKTYIKCTINDKKISCEKFKLEKITEPHANSLYDQRDYKRKRENLTAAMYLK